MDWVWWAFDEVIGTLLGTIIATFASLLTGLSCLVGSDAGCRNFPHYFDGLTTVAPKAIGLAAICFVLVRPGKSLQILTDMSERIHYLFVPHQAAATLRKRGTPDSPRPIRWRELAKLVFAQGPGWWTPAFVLRNRARKAALHAKELEAEAELLRQVFERERARDNAEEAKKHYASMG
jgi:hypothetical protein